jgi:hypothetical protein
MKCSTQHRRTSLIVRDRVERENLKLDKLVFGCFPGPLGL